MYAEQSESEFLVSAPIWNRDKVELRYLQSPREESTDNSETIAVAVRSSIAEI